MRAIRARCLDCSAGSSNEVSHCQCSDCALFPYRFGKRPSTIQKKKELSERGSRLPIGETEGASVNEGVEDEQRGKK